MNASQFMDKQIMDLTASSSLSNSAAGKDFIDLMSHPKEEDNHGNQSKTTSIGVVDNGTKKEEIFPSYDFQPIRPSTDNVDGASGIGGSANSRIWSSVDSKTTNYGSLHSFEPAKILEKDRNAVDMGIVAEIDRTMKKHSDSLMHVLEGVSARLTQLETRTRQLEDSVDDLKVSVGNNQGSMDGKMRQLENILREVQTGVQVLKDKQEVMEAQLQLGKPQVSKADQPSETQNAMLMDFVKQAASAPQQSHQPLPPAGSFPQSQPQVPASPVIPPPALPQQNLPPPVQHPNQFPQSQVLPVLQRDPPYFPPPVQTQEAPNQQYQVPPTQQPQPPPAAPPHQPHQPASQPPYSQPLGPPQPHQHQTPLGHHPEEPPYIPSQGYAPNLRQPPSQPPSGSAPAQQYYGAPPHMYDPPPSRPSSGFSTGFIPPSVPGEPYAYGGTSSQYGSGPTMKTQQIPPLPMPQSGGSGYPQLPTARVLPHALPTASGVGSGSSPPRSGNRVPIDDVIDKVTSMGFPRDHVRATVRKLTDSGQSVDLNVVLDKLMNDGEVQPQRGWFGR